MTTWREESFFKINSAAEREEEMSQIKALWEKVNKEHVVATEEARMAFVHVANGVMANGTCNPDVKLAYDFAQKKAELKKVAIKNVWGFSMVDVARLEFIGVALGAGKPVAEIQDLMVPIYNEPTRQRQISGFRSAIRDIDPESIYAWSFNHWMAPQA